MQFIVWTFLRAPSLQNQPLYKRHGHRTVSWKLQISVMFAGHEAVIHTEMCAFTEKLCALSTW